jgi:hypothetical protein
MVSDRYQTYFRSPDLPSLLWMHNVSEGLGATPCCLHKHSGLLCDPDKFNSHDTGIECFSWRPVEKLAQPGVEHEIQPQVLLQLCSSVLQVLMRLPATLLLRIPQT